MPTQTYWLEPTGEVALGLRRYTTDHGEYTCAAGWHEALVWTGEGPARLADDEHGRAYLDAPEPVDPGDRRWPAGCGHCGHRFTDQDPRQTWQELLYLRPATGDRYTIHPRGGDSFPPPPGVLAAGPGASYDAWWYPSSWRGPDGIALVVLCPRPDGSPGPAWDWGVDRESSSGGRWTRTGNPRAADVTASPSISIGDPAKPGHYHGFLQGGVLTDHLG